MAAGVMIITGPPGAGKSTIAAVLARRHDRSVHLHTDDFWHFITSGRIPAYLPESDEQNHTVLEVIADAAFDYAEGGYTTFVDGIVGPWMLRHFADRASASPATSIHYVVLRPERSIALSRAQSRIASDALVEEEPILSMWDQFSRLDGFEHHVLDTSGEDSATSADRVAGALDDDRFRLTHESWRALQ